jgi:uncharacterized protein YlxW (UPF0749 family)
VTPKDTASLPPVEVAKNGIKVTIRWKLIATIASIAIGGMSVAGATTIVGVNFASADEVSKFRVEQDVQHSRINKTLDDQETHAKQQDERIEEVTKVVKSVQSTQLRDVARTEARRLTEKISNRLEREDTYDRLYELNLKRMERGDDPCGSIDCD